MKPNEAKIQPNHFTSSVILEKVVKMIRHEHEDLTNLTAAQTRVTPEELAAAITRIEARQDASQRNQEGTIEI
jgi:hypothetical protein